MKIEEIKEKVESGVRITKSEALFLFDYPDLLTLGEIARQVKEKRFGKKAFFNRNFHLNLTNVCISNCRFCSYSKRLGEEGSYTLSFKEALDLVSKSYEEGITEVHIVNGLHPQLPFDYYLEIIEAVKERYPELSVKAFTAVEIDHFSILSGLSHQRVMERIWQAGVRFLPGGGAEIFNPRPRALLGINKISGEKWIEIHQLAHQIGFKTNATMLYGHFEKAEEIIEHLQVLREAQDKTGGFISFIPLKFQPWQTKLKKTPSTCVEDLRVFALSRIFLDNFPHIKAYWVTTGLKVAQMALHFGADDIDGTIKKEVIMHAAGSPEKEGLTVEEVVKLISEAGFEPVERNTFYQPLKNYAA